MPNQFYIQPADLSAGLGGIYQALGARKKREAEQERISQQNAILAEGAEILQGDDPDAIADFAMRNPQMAEVMDKAIGFRSEATKRNAIEAAKNILINGANPVNELVSRAEMVASEGGDPSGTMELARQAQQDPRAAIDEAQKVLALYDPQAWKEYRDSFLTDSQGSDLKVGAQEILEDGTIIQSTSQGPVVYSSTGERVTGKAAADAVKAARSEKVKNLRLAAGEKKRATLEAQDELEGKVKAGVIGAEEAAKASLDAFNRLEKVNTAIANMDEAIDLLDQGAETGVVTSKLPSVRAASVKLDNLQGRLGLDVIGNTTFGALSEAELRFALDTALPKKLSPPQLKEWLIEKKAAQEKLADYLEAAAIYLGTPGNTVVGWMEQRKGKQSSPAGASSEYPEGTVIRNPSTGQTMIMRNGQWEAQ